MRETGAVSPTAGDLADEAVKGTYEACIVAGGDGTVQPAALRLLDTGVVLGILPYGSFMNIANGLGISLVAREAVEDIAARHVVRCDVGDVAGRVFFETAGVGLDAEAFGAARLAERRRYRGALRRVWRAATQGSHRVELSIDGTTRQHRVFQILVANSPYYLWSFPVADSKMDDGLLEVAVYARMGRLALARGLVGLWKDGRYPQRPITYRGARISLRSREPLAVHADGKVVGTLPVEISCRRGALAVYAPPQPARR